MVYQAPMVEACRSMPQHLFLGLVGGGFEACRSTLKIGLGFFGKKYRTKISIPSLSTHLSEMASTLVVKCCICDWEVSVSFLELTICGTSQGRGP